MIIPVRCFTCGKVIGNKWEAYLGLLQAEYTEGWASDATKRQPNLTFDLFGFETTITNAVEWQIWTEKDSVWSRKNVILTSYLIHLFKYDSTNFLSVTLSTLWVWSGIAVAECFSDTWIWSKSCWIMPRSKNNYSSNYFQMFFYVII